MKTFLCVVFVGVFLCFGCAFAQSPIGVWTDKAKDTFELYGDSSINGKIRSLNPPTTPAGKQLTDVHNPDGAKHNAPLLGLVFIKDFKPAGNGLWKGGTIYDPKSGKTYSCTMQMNGNDLMDVHGFIGISLLGRTEHWTRLNVSAK